MQTCILLQWQLISILYLEENNEKDTKRKLLILFSFNFVRWVIQRLSRFFLYVLIELEINFFQGSVVDIVFVNKIELFCSCTLATQISSLMCWFIRKLRCDSITKSNCRLKKKYQTQKSTEKIHIYTSKYLRAQKTRSKITTMMTFLLCAKPKAIRFRWAHMNEQ